MTTRGYRISTLFIILALSVGIALSFASPGAAETKQYKITLAGASPGGLWSLLGEGVSAAMAKAFPGSSISYQTSGGGLANIPMVVGGKVEMGLAHNVEVKAALLGQDPYKEPIKDLYTLAYMYDWSPQQFLITKSFAEKYGLETVQDLADKKPPVKMGVNRRGNMVEAVNRAIFSAYGFTYEDIESWGGQVVFAASGEMANLMRDRRIDLMANSVFAPHSSILETANAIDVKLLSLSPQVIEKVTADMGCDPWVVKKGAYDWLDKDIPTVSLGCMLLVQKGMSEEDVYAITKALVENIDAIRNVHKSMKSLTPELMASQKLIPYHPGAAKYYREAGLLK